MRTILALTLAVACLSAAAHDRKDDPPADPPAPAPAPIVDKLNGRDKGKHFVASALAGMACTAAITRSEDFLPNFGCAMVPGLVKELADSQQAGNRFSWRDMVANAAGAGLGVQVGRCIVYGRGFLCRMEF